LREAIDDTHQHIVKRVVAYSPVFELLANLIQWAELQEALSHLNNDPNAASGFKAISRELRKFEPKSTANKQEDRK
jgi:hypothetical protein